MHGLQGAALSERQGSVAADIAASQRAAEAAPSAPPKRKFVPRERAVPSSSVGRVLGFAQLGTSLLYGTVREGVSRALGGRRSEDRCGAGGALPRLVCPKVEPHDNERGLEHLSPPVACCFASVEHCLYIFSLWPQPLLCLHV